MRCQRCGEEAPDGAIYCPHCCGGEKLPSALRIGMRWGLVGLALGLAAAAALLAIYGPVRGIKGIALALPLGAFATGLVLGFHRYR